MVSNAMPRLPKISMSPYDCVGKLASQPSKKQQLLHIPAPTCANEHFCETTSANPAPD